MSQGPGTIEDTVQFVRDRGWNLSAESEACLRALKVETLYDIFGDGGCVEDLVVAAAEALAVVDDTDGHMQISFPASHGAWRAIADGGLRKLELVVLSSKADFGC